MSRIGKKPVAIPDKVTVTVKGSVVTVKGPKGELTKQFHPEAMVEVKDKEIIVSRKNNTNFQRALHGSVRAIIAGMVTGVSDGYERKLDIIGVGFKAEAKGKVIQFNLGFSHPILFAPPTGVEIAIPTPTSVSIKGINKELVGQVAQKIRSFKMPEPYKGKGIKYSDETIRRKAGKAATKK
ncbi:MAG TPA: 50S ribosomal protein L6 [bacterium]|nr:50S ribosomal protein L6 [bacterium]HMW36744.1 50S ribosomal protein L6 [bacterium]HMY37086.1 50S ribosomal protein L6 [bacterium]HMZ04444.1 50S ribosomal protein L6 [bacterium]HNB09087.1 50S ribosomal protein L6 [bacterium]